MQINEMDRKQVVTFIPYLLVPMVLSIVSYGELLNLLILVSLYLGYRYKPQKIWLTWLASVVLLWVTYGISAALSIIPFEEGGETWWSFALEAFIFMAGLVALPMWIARWFASRG